MILKKTQVDALLADLARTAQVYVPKTIEGVSKFAPLDTPEPCDFELTNTMMPPKDVLFPQTQKMYNYGVDENGSMYIKPFDESREQVVFGIRPCDMQSLACLDDVFLTKGFVDEFYQAGRDKLLTVCIGCTSPAETCFCDSMGVDPTRSAGADIQLSDAGDAYVVEAISDKGTAALETWKPYLEDGSATPTKAAPCTLKVEMAGVKEKLDGMFDHPIWDEIATKCLNCGTCTYVCPTCHCFDISQENKMKDGVRFRCWDSCMFSEYTAMAGGHNPRPSKMKRVRNRFMHKLNYFEDRYGKTLCVGCGRCVEHCPVALDITCLIDTISQMGDADA